VLSAWCLGVLNSHRRFLLSYASPVAWNAVIIAALVGLGPGRDPERVAIVAAWASVGGSVLQFAVQLPAVVRLDRALRLAVEVRSPDLRTVFASFAPVFVGRGVVQVSGWLDQLISTFVSAGAAAVLGYAQALAMLPVSLFGMSVSAAELPEFSTSADAAADRLRERLDAGLRRVAFFVVPSAMSFLAIGDVIAGGVYQSGLFTRDTAVWVWAVLAGSSVGLLASTLGRLYGSALYAVHDARTPFRCAVARVVTGTLLGLVAALLVPRWLGIEARWGVAGLTAGSGVAAWLEFTLLRRAVTTRFGVTGVPAALLARLWAAAAAGAAAAVGVKLLLGVERPLLLAVMSVPLFGAVYVAAARALGVAEVGEVLARLRGTTGR